MSSDEDMPLISSKKISRKFSSVKSSPRVKNEQVTPKKTRKSPKKDLIKDSPKSSPKGSPKKDEEEEEEYKWWLEENRDDTIKWNSLVHNGVLFPPEYQPHGIKMKYKGKEIDLSPNSEEVASFYAALIGTDWVNNDVFQKNFFNDFMQVITVIQEIQASKH